MPREVLSVDIGFAQDGMQAYWETAKHLHDARVELKASLDRIEAQMLERAEGEQDSLWWLAEIAGSILSPHIDALLSMRDLLQGNWLGLLGLLPFIPSPSALKAALQNIGEAGRHLTLLGVDGLSRFRSLFSKIDELSLALRRIGDPPQGVGSEIIPSHNLTIEDVQTAIRETFMQRGGRIDLKGINQRNANIVLDQLTYMSERWPGVHTELGRSLHRFFTSDANDWASRALESDVAWAMVSRNYSYIYLTTQSGFSHPNFARNNFQISSREIVGLNAMGIITHEYSHWVEQWLRAQNDDAVSRFMANNIATADLSAYVAQLTAANAPRNRLAEESWAEGFVAIYHVDPSLWTDYVHELYKFIDDFMGSNTTWRPAHLGNGD